MVVIFKPYPPNTMSSLPTLQVRTEKEVKYEPENIEGLNPQVEISPEDLTEVRCALLAGSLRSEIHEAAKMAVNENRSFSWQDVMRLANDK